LYHHFEIKQPQIRNATQTLQLAGEDMNVLADQADRLATLRISQTDIRESIETLFPVNGGKIAENNAKTRIVRFHECYNAEDVTDSQPERR